MPDSGNGQIVGVHTVDARTLVIGSEDSLKAALDRGPGNASHPNFSFVPGQSHIAIAFASPMMAVMSGSMPVDESAPPFVQDLTNAIRGKIAGSGLAMTAGSDLTVASVMSLTDADAASTAAQALQSAAAQGQQMFPAVRANIPAPLQPIADQVVASLKASSEGTHASISATIPAALVTTLQQNPDILGQLMMMGGGGFGAGPGLPPEQPGSGNGGFPPLNQ
jgi:hypothetical protein